MGGSQSSEEIPGGGSEGYHVLKVQENSPGHRAGLEAYFDYIVSIEGTRLSTDNDALKEILKKKMDQDVKLVVYNSKSQTCRDVKLTPTNTWGGQGLLGVSIRFCSFEGASENVWHVLEVHPNSPASDAGLCAHRDYIVGSDMMMNEDDFYSLVENSNHKELKLYVYNVDTDICREVNITPNSDWGGDGSLGCGIGYGYLHRIPSRPAGAAPSKVQDPEMGTLPVTAPPSQPAVTSDGFSEVPLSVPSQPSSPESKQQATGLDTGFAAMTIAATTALPITTTQADPTFPASNLGAGLMLQHTTSNTTITPAPVTIVRSSPVPPDPSKPPQHPAVPSATTSSLGIHPVVGMTTTASHESYQQTSSGLPTAPPTNFPMSMMMPPTISLGPTPILQSGTSHTPSSSAQQ